MYDIILMDLDNTILDFDAAEKYSLIKIIEIAGLTYTEELLSKYRKINTALWRDLEQGKVSKKIVLNTCFQKFFQQYGITLDGRDWEEKYRSYLDNSSALIPHAKYTLTELKKMGKKIYSASNGVYNTQLKRLSNAGIIDWFDGHFISEKIGHEKPSPIFLNSVSITLIGFPKAR